MFQRTRLKLTMWYMFILIFVSSCFSTVIYRLMAQEVNRFAQLQQFRIEKRIVNGTFVPISRHPVSVEIYDPDLIADIKSRLFFMLISINGIIWVISSFLAYMLAGKTLRPIQLMVQDQHRFISDASHELKTPLTSLRTAFEVFSRDKNSTLQEAKVLIDESMDEVNKLQKLSDGLLQLAQYQTTNGHSKFEQIYLDGIIKSAIKTVSPMAKKKNITIESEIIPAYVQGSKQSLSQLITILLDNAVKYTPENGKVKVELQRQLRYISVRVIDSGIGIGREEISHIFDRFFRTDTARSKQKSGGYGLGLAIAKEIMSAHQGTISVRSIVGKGSVFSLKFPLQTISQIE